MVTKTLKSKKKTSKPKRLPLSPERIELCALELIERQGLASFSQRSLARELGVEAMSLYHWHPSRLALLNALLDRILSDFPISETEDPMQRLREIAWSFRALGLRYPNFFGQFVLQHRFNTETALSVLERFVATCAEIAKSDHDTALVFRAFVHFLMGALLDETSGYTGGPGAENPPSEQIMQQRFPNVVRLGPYNKAEHHEENFKFGLELVLAALGRGPAGL